MKLCTSVIFEELSTTYCVKSNNDVFYDKDLIAPLIYNNGTILKYYIYIVQSDQLEFFNNIFDVTVISIGDPNLEMNYKGLDILILPDSTNFYKLFNKLIFIFQKYNQWESSINSTIYENLNLQKIFELSEPILPKPMCLIDNELNYIAYNSNFFSDNELSYEFSNKIPLYLANYLKLEEDFIKLEENNDVFLYTSSFNPNSTLCFNIKINGIYKARLTYSIDGESYTSAEKFIFNFFAILLQKIYTHFFYNANNSNNNLQLNSIIEEVIFSNTKKDSFDIELSLNQFGWKINDTYFVVFIKFIQNKELNWFGSYFCHQLELKWKNSCAIKASTGIILVINQSHSSDFNSMDFYQELSYILRESVCKAGVSNTFSSFTSLDSYYRQAEIAVSLGDILNETIWCHHFKDYVLHYMIMKSLGEFSPLQLCNNDLLKLKEYDSIKGTDYYKTLYTYIENKYNATSTADALFIHRTTLLSRLNKIFKMSNINIDCFNTRLHLMISFYLLNVTKY